MADRGPSSSPQINILLVDDRAEHLLALEVILGDFGVRLVKASSGPEALRCVLEEDFAAIVLDVSMPGMDGFETARLIKRRDRSRHVPIIFVTATSEDLESVYRAYELGAVDFISKPLDASVVRAKLTVFVELYRQAAEIRRQAELIREAELRRRDAELAELRGATELRYRNLADAIPQIVWTADPAGSATYFNQRWADYTGLSPAQSAGHGWRAVLHPNDAQRFSEQWGRARAAGEPLRVECRLRGARGGYRWHLGEVLPERDRAQRLLGWLATFTDVDEQKRMEEERARALLREQMARAEAELAVRRLELLAEASHLLGRSLDAAGIVRALAAFVTPRLCSWCVVDLIDADGRLEQVAFAHEHEALAALGPDLAERLPEGSGAPRMLRRDRPEVSAAPGDAAQLASALGARVDVVRRLGAAAYVSVPLSARGQVLGVMTLVAGGPDRAFGPPDVALAADLGQRAALAVDNARLYADAQRAVRLRDDFLSIASHELRTPLSALELQVQSVQIQLDRWPMNPERLAAKAAVIERQVERLSRLINEMLDVSRIEAGRLELDREEVDLAELVRDVAGRFAGELERAGSEIAVETADGVIGAWDRARLDQVVSNLLQNAIKYGEGKPIRIAAGRDGGTAVLTVEDHGIGISAADQRRIFGRFERAVSPRRYGGIGVGLFIVDQILGAHGGGIAVQSELGKGSTFVARLPIAAPVAAPPEDPPDHARGGAPSGVAPRRLQPDCV